MYSALKRLVPDDGPACLAKERKQQHLERIIAIIRPEQV